MTQYQITYGVGGGYNDIRDEVIDADSHDEAIQIAYELSVEVFLSYGIADDHYLSDEELEEGRFQELIEEWCDYDAVAI